MHAVHSYAFTVNHAMTDHEKARGAAKPTSLLMSTTPQAISSNENVDAPSDIIDTILYPQSEFKKRMDVGKNDQFSDNSSEGSLASSAGAMGADDPRLSLTYHEFPLESMNELLKLAVQEYEAKNGEKPKVLVDLGSGCGRLVLFAALAGDDEKYFSWQEVNGIEIGDQLHKYALDIVQRGIDDGCLLDPSSKSDDLAYTKICFHRGAASDLKHILSQSDVIFCYSTVFNTEGFDVEMGTMVLAREWSMLLADACRPGTVAITTDRALNPTHGWKLQHSLNVENPSLIGSTGYISIL